MPDTVLDPYEQKAPNRGLRNRESLPEVTTRMISRSLLKEMVQVELDVRYSGPGNKIYTVKESQFDVFLRHEKGKVKRGLGEL